MIAEYGRGAAPSAPTREYIYSGGALLAKIESGGTTYYHADHLSVRLMTRSTRPPRRAGSGQTDSSGNIIGQQGHYPFGESWYQTNTTTKWLFTSYERDGESGNDYASFRYDVNRLGRFASPDLLAGSPADPQSLNRYAYVLGDPVNLVDPLGQRFSYICGFTHDCLGGGAGLRMDEACGGPFSLACDGGGFDSGDTCFTAVCQNPGDVLLDGFVTDRGEAEPIVEAGFGFVCPTTDCSGATLTTFNGVDSAIRVPNCSDPTVEDCGYSYYLTNGSTGALGLSGAAPGDDGAAGGGAPGPTQPQKQVPNNKPSRPGISSKVEKFACKGSPSARILASMEQGAVVGAVRGAVLGAAGGEILDPLGGGVPGAILGGFVGGTIGAAAGVFTGSAIAFGCALAGAY